jgi:DNA polymerase III epsilon subunit-like protein
MFGFDLETTGTNPRQDRPVQASVIWRDNGTDRTVMNTLINPLRPIPGEAAAVHHITDDMVRSAPDASMVAWQISLLYDQLQPDFIVGFNSISFDETMLDACLGTEVFPGRLHIDVLDVAYRYFPEAPGHKLGFLFKEMMGHDLEGAHDASTDVTATLDLLQVMLPKIGMTMAQLDLEMRTPKPWVIMPLGKHKGKLLEDVDPGWARWMRNNATDMRPDLLASVNRILGAA